MARVCVSCGATLAADEALPRRGVLAAGGARDRLDLLLRRRRRCRNDGGALLFYATGPLVGCAVYTMLSQARFDWERALIAVASGFLAQLLVALVAFMA